MLKPPMKLFADTEFNQYGGETISLGIVADDNTEFYEVRSIKEAPTDWVAAHVMPVLNKMPVTDMLFQSKLAVYLGEYYEQGIELIVDHPADVQRFLQLLETDDRGGWLHVPQLTIKIVTVLPGQQTDFSLVEHNALSDARALRDRYLEMTGASGDENI